MRAADDPAAAACAQRRGRVLSAALLVVLVFVAFWPALRAGFIWDDNRYVTQNPLLADAAGLRRIWTDLRSNPQYYPLVHTSFWLENQLWGKRPVGYHLDNVLLHAVAALLLCSLLGRIGHPAPWLGAALFALHPVQVESVAWVTERKNILSGVFFFLSLIWCVRFHGLDRPPDAPPARGRAGAYALAMGSFVAALLAKTVAAVLPGAVLILLWWRRRRIGWAEVAALAPFFIVGAGFGLLTVWLERVNVGASGREWSLTFPERVLVAGRALWFYLGKLVVPADLAFSYRRWEVDAAAIGQWVFPVGFVAVLLLLWALRERLGRGPLAAFLFFAVALFPALGFFNVYPMRYSWVADHFQYLACAGPLALAAAAAARLGSVGKAPAILALSLLCAASWFRAQAFHDPEALWRDTLRKTPTSWLAHNDLGRVLETRGDDAGAARHYEETIRLNPLIAEPHLNLGNIAARAGRPEEARERYEGAIRAEADDPRGYYNLGLLARAAGDRAGAIHRFREAADRDPRFVPARVNLGFALLEQGRIADADAEFRSVLAFSPGLAEARHGLGMTLLQASRPEEALLHLREAVRLAPTRGRLHADVARALAALGRVVEASAELAEARHLDQAATTPAGSRDKRH